MFMILALAVVSFVLVYLARRRFGVLILMLTAGSMLAQLWSVELTSLMINFGVTITHPPLLDVITATITVAPSLIFLFVGPTTNNKKLRIFGALMFACMTILVLFDSLKNSMQTDSFVWTMVVAIEQQRPLLITAGLIMAFVDVSVAYKKTTRTSHKKS